MSAVTAPPFDIQGHRGARGLMPENTLPAFWKALELGVTTLEMDVVISADSQVVVSHDPWFSPEFCSLPTGEPVPADAARTHRLYILPYAEIARYDCGLRGHPRFPRQQKMAAVKPLLREVIRMAEAYTATHDRPPVFYNIETKSTPEGDGVLHPPPGPFVDLLYDVLAGEGIVARTTIQSFDGRTLQAARERDPSLSLALLVAAPDTLGPAARLAALGFTPALYSPDYHLVDADLIADVHARGMRVIPWTVNTPAEMQRLHDLGADGLITDYPDVAVALFR